MGLRGLAVRALLLVCLLFLLIERFDCFSTPTRVSVIPTELSIVCMKEGYESVITPMHVSIN